MGQVWLAESQDRARQRVAIKFIKSKNINANLRDRFEREKESLGRMNHESVAKIFDSGVLPEYGPYIVMEHVAGYEIDLYAKSHNLSLKEILRLFVEVCDAIMHAHSKMVLHRDIKPGNILVKNDDGSGHLTKGSNRRFQVKVIDFGIARIVDTLPFEGEAQTVEGDVIGTNGYMSPESALGEKDRIDTRSDVYSLGVLLYELLHGHLPYSPFELKKVSTKTELIRVYEGEAGIWKAEKSDRLDLKDVPKDLKLICEKSMRFEPDARYGSPAELAQDCLNYLEGNEVEARPPSLSYKFTRFASRNKKSISVASLFLILIVGSLSLLLGQNSVLVKTADNLRSSQREVLLRYREATLSSIELLANSRDEDARTQLATMDFDVRSESDLSDSVSQSLTEVRDVVYGMLYGHNAEVGLEDGLPKNLGFDSFTAHESNTDALFFSRAVTDSNTNLRPLIYHMVLREGLPHIQRWRSSISPSVKEKILEILKTDNPIPIQHTNFFYDLCFSSKSSSFFALYGGLLFEITIDEHVVIDVRVLQLALDPLSRVPTSLFVDELGDAFVTFKIPDAGLFQIQKIVADTTGLSLGPLQHDCPSLGPDVTVVHQFENGDQVLVDMENARSGFQSFLNGSISGQFSDSGMNWDEIQSLIEQEESINSFAKSLMLMPSADFECTLWLFSASEGVSAKLASFQPCFFTSNDCGVRFVDGTLYWIDSSDSSVNHIDLSSISNPSVTGSDPEWKLPEPNKFLITAWDSAVLLSVDGELFTVAQDQDSFVMRKGPPSGFSTLSVPGSMAYPRMTGPESCVSLGNMLVFADDKKNELVAIDLLNDVLPSVESGDFSVAEKISQSVLGKFHDHLVFLDTPPSGLVEFFPTLFFSGDIENPSALSPAAFIFNELNLNSIWQSLYPSQRLDILNRSNSIEYFGSFSNIDYQLFFDGGGQTLTFEDVQSLPYLIPGQGGELETNRVLVLHDEVVVVPPDVSSAKVLSTFALPDYFRHPSHAVRLQSGETLIFGGTQILKYGSNDLLVSTLEIPDDDLPSLFGPEHIPSFLTLQQSAIQSVNRELCAYSISSALLAIDPTTYLYQVEQSLFLVDAASMRLVGTLHLPRSGLGSSLPCQRISPTLFAMQASYLDGFFINLIEFRRTDSLDGVPSLANLLTIRGEALPSGVFFSSEKTGPSLGNIWSSNPVGDSGLKLRTSFGVPVSSTPQPLEPESDPLPDPKE